MAYRIPLPVPPDSSTLLSIYNFVFYVHLRRILYDKRFNAFHFPVSDEDAPNYRVVIQNPMDMATLLQRVDSGQYITCPVFVQDVDLIVSNAKVIFSFILLTFTGFVLHETRDDQAIHPCF